MKVNIEEINLTQYNLQTKVLWCLVVFSGAAAGLFGLLELADFSVSNLIVLSVSIFISLLVNQHLLKTSDNEQGFSATEMMVFWSLIWLGPAGGVCAALSASAARYSLTKKSFFNFLFGAAVNVFAAFTASKFFYFILRTQTGFSENFVAAHDVRADFFFAALLGAAVVHYLLSGTLNSLLLKFDSDIPAERLWKENFVFTVPMYLTAAASVVVLHFIFVYFGIEFGLVLVPIAVAGHFAYRIHERSLQQKTREISEASRVHLATVEALATAIDARDQVGVGHVRRAQIYAIGIGKILNLPESEIAALRTGALLHDIGKLAIPDHILNKPGRLTPAETEKIKIHSAVGASILERVGFTYPVVPTVKYHHESWDGTGYPEGLKGEQIPLTARILCIADAYDTLRGARPYRPAVSREEARKFLLNGAGVQFDPRIVDVFMRNLRKFESKIEREGLSYLFDSEDTGEYQKSSESPANQSYVEQIKRANREVFTLYELAKVFSSSLNLQETLSLFTKKIGEFIPFDTCAVYLLDAATEFGTAVWVEGKHSLLLKNKRIKVGEGATGFVLKKSQPVHKINPGLDFSFSHIELVREYASMVSLPLIAGEKLIGAVSLYSCDLDNYEEEHLRLLETVSRIAADAISKSLQHAETETRALTDPMTGLANARSLQMQFEKEAARHERSGASLQVLMLDLDGFKAVNDTFGHKVGDRLLKGISRVMLDELREYDFLARYAGDEFVAIIPETDANSVRDLCKRLEKAVFDYRLQISDDVFASVGVSLGAASYPQAGVTFDQIVIAADKAMYDIKSARKREREKQKQESLKTRTPKKQETTLDLIELPNPKQMPAISHKEMSEDNFIVELDESHIVSSAIN